MSDRSRRRGAALGAAAILVAIVWRLGTGPVLAGLRSVDLAAVLAALAIGATTTVAAAWRWRTIAAGLGIGLPLRAAVAASYRAQFLNAVLPAGVLGDVHRAARHGRSAGDRTGAARAVVAERAAGQAVQIALTVVVLLVAPAALSRATVFGVLGVAAVAAALVGAIAFASPKGSGLLARATRAVRDDTRMVFTRPIRTTVVITSTTVVIGHCATFVVAARAAGVTLSLPTLVPIGLVVLVATAVPLNIGGWGVREGAAVALLAAAGVPASSGAAAATVYGVLVFVSTVPGLIVLATDRRRTPASTVVPDPPPRRVCEGAVRG